MTYLEALYGSQYYEIAKKGKDGSAGRLNGNLFLTAFIIISMFLVIALLVSFTDFSNDINRLFHKLFGYSSGKVIGRLLAIPLMLVIYFVISKTVGSKANYEKIVQSFLTYSDEEKQKATMKLLAPFFIVLGGLLLLSMASLF